MKWRKFFSGLDLFLHNRSIDFGKILLQHVVRPLLVSH